MHISLDSKWEIYFLPFVDLRDLKNIGVKCIKGYVKLNSTNQG